MKLARAATEAYAQEFIAKNDTTSAPSKDNPTRKSNIFLAIQPTIYSQSVGATSSAAPENKEVEGEEAKVVVFAIYLYDPIHTLSFATVSQALPAQWLEWLDAPVPKDTPTGDWALPEVIRSMVDMGGIDPREWIVEWVEEAVGLAVGVVAQKYVARRMRVGEVMGDPTNEVPGSNRELGL